MNPLAQELNTALSGTVVPRLFSGLGEQMYFPRGIVSQSAEASARAHRLNATIGMAVEEGEPMVLPLVASQVPGLSRKELASYAPTAGVPALREAWKRQLLDKNPSLVDGHFSMPVVVPGLTNGVFQITELFVNPGDVVIMPDMFWGNYRLIMEVRRGARIVTFPLFSAAGGFNAEGLAEAVQANAGKGKIILALNFPNNPTGYAPSMAEVDALCSILVRHADKGTDFLVLCDDAYFGLFFEEETCKESVFARCAGLHERILAAKVDGATKEDYVWGFRLGFVTFAGKGLGPAHYEALQKKLMGAIRGSISSSSGLAQQLMLKTYLHKDYSAQKKLKLEELTRRYHRVRELVEPVRKDPAHPLEVLPFNSGYFMAFRCRGLDAEQLRLKLLDQGIGTIAIGTEYLRVAYSSVDYDDLAELYAEIHAMALSMTAGTAG